jgi:hypothetical protein
MGLGTSKRVWQARPDAQRQTARAKALRTPAHRAERVTGLRAALMGVVRHERDESSQVASTRTATLTSSWFAMANGARVVPCCSASISVHGASSLACSSRASR